MAEFRKVEKEELTKIAHLEQLIFSDAWSIRSLTETWQTKEAVIYGAFEGNVLVGYAILYCILDEGELVRIAVAPDCRRKGVADGLFAELFMYCQSISVCRMFLEVRRSNESARALYEKHGFIVDGCRKNYYEEPTEDAILMSLEVPVLPTGSC